MQKNYKRSLSDASAIIDNFLIIGSVPDVLQILIDFDAIPIIISLDNRFLEPGNGRRSFILFGIKTGDVIVGVGIIGPIFDHLFK